MAERRRRFDRNFKDGAVRLVRETGRPIAEVARAMGINEGAGGNGVNGDRRRRGDGNGALSEDERAGVARLRKENAGQERVHQSHAGATCLAGAHAYPPPGRLAGRGGALKNCSVASAIQLQ